MGQWAAAVGVVRVTGGGGWVAGLVCVPMGMVGGLMRRRAVVGLVGSGRRAFAVGGGSKALRTVGGSSAFWSGAPYGLKNTVYG